MTKKKMLALVNSKALTKLIENGTDFQRSVFPHLLKPNSVIKSTNDQICNQKIRQQPFLNKNEKSVIDHQTLLTNISRLLKLEIKYYMDCSFLFFVDPVTDDKVNAEMRDNAVKNIMNMNKIFYEVPIEIFVKSVSILDRFITKVKVKPKYITCVAVACFYIAAKTEFAELGILNICPTLASLSQLSKCGGSVEDLERMTDIILTKLNYNLETVTPHDFLMVFYRLMRENSSVYPLNVQTNPEWRRLMLLLELGQQSLRICCQRPCLIALSCFLANSSNQPNELALIKTLAALCKADLAMITQTTERIIHYYRLYCTDNNTVELKSTISLNTFGKTQRFISKRDSNLIWIISKRTLSSIYVSTATSLSTIQEEELPFKCNSSYPDTEDWSGSFEMLFKE